MQCNLSCERPVNLNHPTMHLVSLCVCYVQFMESLIRAFPLIEVSIRTSSRKLRSVLDVFYQAVKTGQSAAGCSVSKGVGWGVCVRVGYVCRSKECMIHQAVQPASKHASKHPSQPASQSCSSWDVVWLL